MNDFIRKSYHREVEEGMIKDIVYFAKVREGARMPDKREEDGCYDLFPCFEENEVVIPAHAVRLIPTGIASAFNPCYRIAFRERGTNTKVNLSVMAGQIDSGYRGEYWVALQNNNDIPVEISKSIKDIEKTEDFIRFPYSKAIAQFALEEVPKVQIKEISYDDLLQIESERGINCLGSTDTKQ